MDEIELTEYLQTLANAFLERLADLYQIQTTNRSIDTQRYEQCKGYFEAAKREIEKILVQSFWERSVHQREKEKMKNNDNR